MRDRYNNSDDQYKEGEEKQEEVRVPPKPTKEEKEFLSIREKLKQKFRQNMLKERASTFGQSALHETPKTSSQDKFGSFFGPSLPGIAPRIIEETKSIKKNGYFHSSSKSSGSSTTVCVPVNEVKRKAHILKKNRDYSFLFSDDAEAPHNPCTKSKPGHISASWFVPNLRLGSVQFWVVLYLTSQPSSTKPIKEASRGHLIQQLQRQGTSRQPPLPQSNRTKPISNGSPRPSPSTGAKRVFHDKDYNAIDIISKMFKLNFGAGIVTITDNPRTTLFIASIRVVNL